MTQRKFSCELWRVGLMLKFVFSYIFRCVFAAGVLRLFCCCFSGDTYMIAWVLPVLVSQWCNLTSLGLCTTEMGGLCTAFAFLHGSPLGDVKKRSLVQCMCGNRLNSLTVAWEEMNLSETIFLRLDQRNGHINCKKPKQKKHNKAKRKINKINFDSQLT